MPRPGQRAMVRPYGLQPCQLVRPVGTVSTLSLSPVFVRSYGELDNASLQLRPVPGLGCPRRILPVGEWRTDGDIPRSAVHRVVRFRRLEPLEWRVPRRRQYR
jgi:hypothetical protein